MIKRTAIATIFMTLLVGVCRQARATGVGDLLFSAPASTDAAQTGSTVQGSTVATVTPAPPEPFLSPLGKSKAHILSGFGQRNPPGTNTLEKHEGIDYRVEPNTAVRSSRSGKIIFAGYSTMYVSRTDKKDKSQLIIIQHADGMSSRYVHLNSLKVKPRQKVIAGQVIGTTAESDEWTEPVLHFEIRKANGKAVDPEDVIEQP